MLFRSDDSAVARASAEVVRLANLRSGEGFIAVSAESRKTFWADRGRTAAIARHTNAFKINEDVVIPLDRMGEYTDGIERINIELSMRNKLDLLAELAAFFERGQLKLGKSEDSEGVEIPPAELLEDRVAEALSLIGSVRNRWAWLLSNFDQPLTKARSQLSQLGLDKLDRKSTRLNSSHTDISRMPSSA